ncbi:energy transducer TonB [Aquimarina gracilis]|uniref:Energy transducer TonB n=1 Tax=Aquimarina gracilis TaxID=874422 RepID=A0ABU5ZPU0_9FLAO|nr:energy transducer TonB [Aquimarina gracilis]MEB3344120.1 energy transducer TonB [Aquimarina gracilis]
MSNKHDANVRKSTLVNFQIGLVASLLFTYVMFEVYTAVPIVNQPPPKEVDDSDTYVWDGRFVEYKEPEQKTVAAKKPTPVVDPQDFDIVDNDTAIKDEDRIFKNEPAESNPIEPGVLPDDPDDNNEPIVYPFTKIEWVPIFPGCEKLKTNAERAACFSEKIRKIVSRKFNTDLGERYGLTGLQRIYTQFDVDPSGLITNIQIRAPHPKLEKEAKRVIELFPQMTPGKQRDTPVTVKYQLPIVFKIQN